MFKHVRPTHPARIYFASVLLGLAATGGAVAAENPPSPNDPATAPVPAAAIPLNSGVSPEEFSSDQSRVTMEVLQNGTRVYHLNGQGMQSVVAHIGANGEIEYTCTDKIDQAVQPVGAKENAHER